MFKQIPRLSSYQINQEGIITNVKGRLLSPYMASGYKAIKLKNDEGFLRAYLIHRLVYQAFIGDIPDKMQINHKNGDKTDNNLLNLELVTPSENLKHAYRVLECNRAKGLTCYLAKLSLEQIEMIKTLLKAGYSQRRIAESFQVSQPNVNRISKNL